jgi:imidazolonepropionase-like amidohydrolase
MRRRFPPLLLLFLALAVPSAAQTLLIRDANIVDPVDRVVRRGSLIVRNGRIVDVVTTAPAAFDGEVIEAGGKWLIPGLNDMHVHSFGNVGAQGAMEVMGTERAARVMLFTGVTGFLDLFSMEDQIFALRDQQRREGSTGADIYASGPILTSTGGHGTEYGIPTRIIDSPADARREIAALAKKRPDVVKIVYDHAGRMPTIDRATMQAAIRAAKGLKLKTVVHIGTWTDAAEAVEAGASAITHTYGPEVIPDALVALMKKRKVVHIPTLAVQTELVNIVRDARLLDDPLLAQSASSAVIDSYRDTSKLDARLRGFLAWLQRVGVGVPSSVAKLHRAGVPILAGTDVGNPGTFQGYSLHRELELLVAAGLTEWEALASATTAAGTFLGQKYGVRPGDVANLVLLDASPIERIANTRRIAAVIHHGRIVDRAALLAPVDAPAASAAWTATVIDDFSSETLTSSSGPAWSVDTDAAFGGASTATVTHTNGRLTVAGRLAPKSGMPGLAGISLMFHPTNPVDLSAYTGIRIRVTATSGMLQLKLVTNGVTNYDYHAAIIPNGTTDQTLEIPFASLRQLWSSPVPWTGKDVRGIALWVTGFGAASEYAFTVDEVGLYPSTAPPR